MKKRFIWGLCLSIHFTAAGFGAPQIEILSDHGADARLVTFRRRGLPELTRFIHEAQKVRPLRGKLRLILSQTGNPDLSRRFRQFFGADYSAQAAALLARLDDAETLTQKNWLSLLHEIHCKFAGIKSLALLQRAAVYEAAGDLRKEWIEYLRPTLLALADDRVDLERDTEVLWESSASYLGAGPKGELGVVVFGFDRGVAAEASIDTVLHEASHWIDEITSPLVKGLLRLKGPAVDEVFADLLAHLFLGTDEHLTALGALPRSLSRLETNPLEDNSYTRGQAVRVGAWQKLHRLPFAIAAKQLFSLRDEVLQRAEPLKGELLFSKAHKLARAEILSGTEHRGLRAMTSALETLQSQP